MDTFSNSTGDIMGNVEYFVFFGTAFVFCYLLTSALMPIARKLNLVDLPTERKQHLVPTPLVGGVAIYTTVCLSAILFTSPMVNFSLLAWFGIVLILGVIDDLNAVRYQIRLFCQACIVAGIFLTVDLAIYDIGALFSTSPVNFTGATALLFTAVAVVGTANAVNMSDGIDGLAALLIVTSLFAIFFYAISATAGSHHISPKGIVVFAGALSAFLLFNCRFLGRTQAAAFLGDAGSTTLGFVLAYLLIDYSQGELSIVSPVLAGWIMGLPLLDGSAVMLHRLIGGKSPCHPGREHLHHLLLDSGISVNKTVLLMLAIHITLIATGIAAFELHGRSADAALFWGFVALVICRVYIAKTYIATRTTIDHKSIPNDF